MSDGRLHCDDRSGGVVVGPGTTGYHFHVGTTMPGPHRLSFPLGFATEGESVFGVLTCFTLLHHFPEGGIIRVLYLPMIPTFLVRLTILSQTWSEPRELSLCFKFTFP